jgi:hypothetical protein
MSPLVLTLMLCSFSVCMMSFVTLWFFSYGLIVILSINDDGFELMIVHVVMFVPVWLVIYGLIVFLKHENGDGYDYVCDLCKSFSLDY